MDHMGKITVDPSPLSLLPSPLKTLRKKKRKRFKLGFVTQTAPKSGKFSGMQSTSLGPRNQLYRRQFYNATAKQQLLINSTHQFQPKPERELSP